MTDLILFFKAQARGAAAQMGDLFGSTLVEKQVQHKGYVDKQGKLHDPHTQTHKVKLEQPKKRRAKKVPETTPKPPTGQLDLFGQPDKKTQALEHAISHLEEDQGQDDIPAEEKKEDAKLVEKLKDAARPRKKRSKASGLEYEELDTKEVLRQAPKVRTTQREQEEKRRQAISEGHSKDGRAMTVGEVEDQDKTLPRSLDAYFDRSQGGSVYAIKDLIPSETDEETKDSHVRARQHMRDAAASKRPKRAPITIRPRQGKDYGKYDVVDGNATLRAAKEAGWTSILAKLEAPADEKKPDAGSLKLGDVQASLFDLHIPDELDPDDEEDRDLIVLQDHYDRETQSLRRPKTVEDARAIQRALTHISNSADEQAQRDRKARETELARQREQERNAADNLSARVTKLERDLPQAEPVDQLEFGVPEDATKGQRKEWNAQAIELLKRHPEGDPWSAVDKQVLARYSGQGGVGDSLNEYYTREDVAGACWALAKGLGFEGGDALEMSCGTGVFLKTAPEGTRLTGVELDKTSSQIAKALFDTEVHNTSAEQFAREDAREFDAVIGNPPYGLRGSLLGEDKQDLPKAEQYFLDTAIDKAKAGGLVIQVVPTGGLDSMSQEAFRDRLSRKAVFLGAFRLPNTAFKHAHTGVTTDIVVFRARPKNVAGMLSALTREELAQVTDPQTEFVQGGYFRKNASHADIYGKTEQGWRAKAGMGNDITVEGSMDGVADAIAGRKLDPRYEQAMGLDPQGILSKVDALDRAAGLDDRAREKHANQLRRAAESRPYQHAKVGETKLINGVLYRLEGNPPRWHRVDDGGPPAALSAARDLVPALKRAQSQGAALTDDARESLREQVQAYVEKHGVPSQNRDLVAEAKATGDRDLYRLIGAVNDDGTLSDWLSGKSGAAEVTMEGAAERLSITQGGFSAEDLAAQLKGGDAEVILDALLASDDYMLDGDGKTWMTARQFMTGDLWKRLDRMRVVMAHEGLVGHYREKYQRQEQALLEKIGPKVLDDVEIETRSAWIPVEVLSEWLNARRDAANRRAIEAGHKAWDTEPVSLTFESGVYKLQGSNWSDNRKMLVKYLNREAVKKDDKPIIDRLNREFKEWVLTSAHREQLEERYNRKFLGYVKPEADDSPLSIPGINPEFSVNKYHYAGLRWALQAEKGIIAADVGLGKAQPLDALVLTPSGYVLMGDIKVGDRVIAGDGSATDVIGVYPQGEKDIYRVVFSDGAVAACCDEHLWLTQTHLDRNNERRQCADLGVPKVRMLSEIRETLTYRGMKNHAIPMVAPVQFEPSKVDIDPYLLGVLLGDGKLSYSTPVITNPESGIIDALREMLPSGYQLRQADHDARCPSYYLSRVEPDGFSGNEFSAALKRYEINVTSEFKRIPVDYLLNTTETRVAVLNGLMDTDGYVSKDGRTVQFTSVSERLADDVVFIVNSIGGTATVKSKVPTYTHNGEKCQGKLAYTVSLRMPPEVNPFCHSVKRERVVPKSKYLPTRYIASVEYVGRKPAQCIKVAHPSHLYVTDDFIVTHNTGRGLMLGALARAHGRAKKPTYVVPKSVLANWVAECETWFPGAKVHVIGEEYARDQDGKLVRDAKGNLKAKADNKDAKARKLAQLAQNDYDFVFISQPAWNEIDLDPMTKGEMLEDDFWVQRGDALGNAGDKQIRKVREQHAQAVASREFRDRSQGAYFNDLGIDCLIIDEMHAMKNLYAVKSRWGDSPRFLGGGGKSNRAFDTNLKSKWFLAQNGNRNIYGLTATPTKNSPLEVYSMLSHIAPEAFENIGIRNSEEFIDRFVTFEADQFLSTTGEIDSGLVCAGFKNLDELRPIMNRYIDRTKASDVGLRLPKAQFKEHLVDMSPQQASLYAELRDEADEEEVHIFSLIDKMSKVSIDPALYDPALKGAATPKIDAAVENALRGIKDGGQVLFCDYLDAQYTIRDKLIAAGVDPKKIAIVNAKEAASASKREGISDQFNKGKLEVVIGNTATMGEGMNLQKRTADIHHLDMTWEPASIHQRNGRGLRQGNKNEAVRIHTYMAKGSFDGYRWQTLLSKGDWQDQLWSGGERVDNPMRQTKFSKAEMAIMLAANPEEAKQALQEAEQAAREASREMARANVAVRFLALQRRKRTYAALENKDSKTAIQLKASIDKETERLRADQFLEDKSVLDSAEPVLLGADGQAWKPGRAIKDEAGNTLVVDTVDLDAEEIGFRYYAEDRKPWHATKLEDLNGEEQVPYSPEAELNEKLRNERVKSVEALAREVGRGLGGDTEGIAHAVEDAYQEATKDVIQWHANEQARGQVEAAIVEALQKTLGASSETVSAAGRAMYRSYLFAAHGVPRVEGFSDLTEIAPDTLKQLEPEIQNELRHRARTYTLNDRYSGGRLFVVQTAGGDFKLRPGYEMSKIGDTERFLMPFPQHREALVKLALAREASKRYQKDYGANVRGAAPSRLKYTEGSYTEKEAQSNPVIEAAGKFFPGMSEEIARRANDAALGVVEQADGPKALMDAAAQFYTEVVHQLPKLTEAQRKTVAAQAVKLGLDQASMDYHQREARQFLSNLLNLGYNQTFSSVAEA